MRNSLSSSISRAPQSRLWYPKPNAVRNAIGYAHRRSRSSRCDLRLPSPLDRKTVMGKLRHDHESVIC
jgi:hypothetical protein